MPPVIAPCLFACVSMFMPLKPSEPPNYYQPTQEQVLKQGKPYCYNATTKRECEEKDKR